MGTTDFREICARVVSGDESVHRRPIRALVYQLAKDIGAMAAVLHFEVDAIVYTGGMAYEQFFCDDITAYVGRLAPSCGSLERRRCGRWRRAPCGCSTVRHRRKHIKYIPA